MPPKIRPLKGEDLLRFRWMMERYMRLVAQVALGDMTLQTMQRAAMLSESETVDNRPIIQQRQLLAMAKSEQAQAEKERLAFQAELRERLGLTDRHQIAYPSGEIVLAEEPKKEPTSKLKSVK